MDTKRKETFNSEDEYTEELKKALLELKEGIYPIATFKDNKKRINFYKSMRKIQDEKFDWNNGFSIDFNDDYSKMRKSFNNFT